MRTRLLPVAALAAIVLASFAAPAAAGNPTTRYVDDDGTAGAAGCGGALSVPSSIQSAEDAASPGDTILVCPGTYTEQIVIDTPDLTIRSIQPWKATVRAPADLAGSPAVLVRVDASDTSLQWLSLRSRTQPPCETLHYAIQIGSSATGVLVRSVRIGTPAGDTLYGPCGFGEGIHVEGGSQATISTTTITAFKSYGVYGNVGSNVTVQYSSFRYWHPTVVCGRLACTAASPASYVNAGVLLFGEGLVRGNAITGRKPESSQSNRLGAGIILSGPGIARANRIVDTGTGIETNGAARVIDNTVQDSQTYGIQVLNDDGIIRGNTVDSSGSSGIIAWSTAAGNLFKNNTATNSSANDCADQSGNVAPAGVPDPIDNTWSGNHGNSDAPDGICTPLP